MCAAGADPTQPLPYPPLPSRSPAPAPNPNPNPNSNSTPTIPRVADDANANNIDAVEVGPGSILYELGFTSDDLGMSSIIADAEAETRAAVFNQNK